MINKYLYLLVVAVLLSSCVSTASLNRGLTKDQATLEYLFDSKINTNEKLDTLSIVLPQISDLNFTSSGSLKKTKTTVIPLIIYTAWGNEHEYSIGQNVMEENVSEFIQKAFIQEMNRSTQLHIDSNSSDLTLEIEVDSISAKGPHQNKGYFMFLFFFYSYGSNEFAGPGEAYSSMRYKLKRNNEIILEGKASSQRSTEPLKDTFQSYINLRGHFTISLVEALSFTLKSNIEDISEEIEQFIFDN